MPIGIGIGLGQRNEKAIYANCGCALLFDDIRKTTRFLDQAVSFKKGDKIIVDDPGEVEVLTKEFNKLKQHIIDMDEYCGINPKTVDYLLQRLMSITDDMIKDEGAYIEISKSKRELIKDVIKSIYEEFRRYSCDELWLK